MGRTEDEPTRRSLRQILRVVVSLALAGAIFAYVLGSAGDFDDVRTAISSMTGPELATLGLAALWNLVTYWIVVVAATPGLTYPQAMVLVESTTAVANAVPGGSAVAVGLTYSMLGSWGFSRSRSTLSVIVSGLWNNFAKLGLPVLALALVALEGGAGAGRITAGLLGIAALATCVTVFALVLRKEDFARKVGDAAARTVARLRPGKAPVEGWGDATVKFRGRTIGLVSTAWKRLTLATVLSHLSLYLVLLLALRHIGVSNDEVSWAQVLAAFAFVRLLTAIPITPGGLGVVELGLIAALTAAGGDRAEVVGAVLIFRGLTYLLPIPLGLLTYLFWRRNSSWRNSAPPLADLRVDQPSVDAAPCS
ncbi:MAG: lysylphosphatidylglycerol synthase transmembrane domain-containing protein [Acidimicrobiales bacterium]